MENKSESNTNHGEITGRIFNEFLKASFRIKNCRLEHQLITAVIKIIIIFRNNKYNDDENNYDDNEIDNDNN